MNHALVVGASRGLGLVLVDELLRRGWNVVATTRTAGGPLQDRAGAPENAGDCLEIAPLEMTSTKQLDALHRHLEGRALDLLFVNAAIDRGDLPINEVPTPMFAEVMLTNALAPLRVLERFRDLVAPGGTLAVMSSEQGSIARNTEPGYDLYKASKAALNQLVRSYATRHRENRHTTLLLDPGHNRTRLGGPDAPLEPEDSIPALVDVLESNAGRPGLAFLDLHGHTVPW